MTPEQKQRIEQINAAQVKRRDSLAFHQSEYPGLPSPDYIDEIDFLLSLVKSQEADEGATRIERLEAQLQGVLNLLATSQREVERLRDGKFTAEEFQNLCHNLNGDDKTAFFDGCAKYQEQLFGVSAATSMRSACVEKVKALRDEWNTEAQDPRADLKNLIGVRARAKVDAANEAIIELETLSIEKPKG